VLARRVFLETFGLNPSKVLLRGPRVDRA